MQATLGELMGSAGKRDMSLNNLDSILGEKMPDLPRNRIGRYRLMRALRNRFGNDYRNIPGVRDIVAEFDDEIRFDGVLGRMKKIKTQKGSK